MSLIQIEHLKKEYPNSTPLKDICCEIRKGEVVSVIGPSGSGKSTLLRCLNRLEEPTAGTVVLNGENITDSKCNITLVRRKMGIVFQTFNLFNNLNVIENVVYAPVTLLKTPKEIAIKTGLELLDRVGMKDRADRFPDELSGGQKQRVAIARAIAMRPEILMMDEPTSALDPTMTGEVLSVIRDLAGDGMTMLIVTHEMKFARDVSDRIFYLDEGIIFEEGTPEEIFEHPKKEKTRQFIRRLKTLDLDIPSADLNYQRIFSQIGSFGKESGLDTPSLRNVMLAFEELIMQNILKAAEQDKDAFPVHFHAEHSEVDGMISVVIRWGGKEYNPLIHGDELSVLLIRKLAEKAAFSRDGGNCVTVRFLPRQ